MGTSSIMSLVEIILFVKRSCLQTGFEVHAKLETNVCEMYSANGHRFDPARESRMVRDEERYRP